MSVTGASRAEGSLRSIDFLVITCATGWFSPVAPYSSRVAKVNSARFSVFSAPLADHFIAILQRKKWVVRNVFDQVRTLRRKGTATRDFSSMDGTQQREEWADALRRPMIGARPARGRLPKAINPTAREPACLVETLFTSSDEYAECRMTSPSHLVVGITPSVSILGPIPGQNAAPAIVSLLPVAFTGDCPQD